MRWEVCSPLMISTSFIFSTGEKKCRPMKSAGRSRRDCSEVIGRVEVFEHISVSGPTTASTSANTDAFRSGSSKTASITASTPARSDA